MIKMIMTVLVFGSSMANAYEFPKCAEEAKTLIEAKMIAGKNILLKEKVRGTKVTYSATACSEQNCIIYTVDAEAKCTPGYEMYATCTFDEVETLTQ